MNLPLNLPCNGMEGWEVRGGLSLKRWPGQEELIDKAAVTQVSGGEACVTGRAADAKGLGQACLKDRKGW